MKKYILLPITILCLFSTSLAQFGIKGGVNIATFGGDDAKQTVNLGNFEPMLSGLPPVTVEPTSKVGFVGGISYKVGLLFGISIQPEVLYVQKGGVYESSTISLASLYPGGSVSGKNTFKMDYISIPVVVKYSILPLPIVKPYIVGGVSYDILVSAKSSVEYTISGVPGYSGTQSMDEDIKESLNKSDFSVQIGIGVEVMMLEVDARYLFGLSKIDKDGVAKMYNRGIVLTAGLRL